MTDGLAEDIDSLELAIAKIKSPDAQMRARRVIAAARFGNEAAARIRELEIANALLVDSAIEAINRLPSQLAIAREEAREEAFNDAADLVERSFIADAVEDMTSAELALALCVRKKITATVRNALASALRAKPAREGE